MSIRKKHQAILSLFFGEQEQSGRFVGLFVFFVCACREQKQCVKLCTTESLDLILGQLVQKQISFYLIGRKNVIKFNIEK